jgi:hypothetical protein
MSSASPPVGVVRRALSARMPSSQELLLLKSALQAVEQTGFCTLGAGVSTLDGHYGFVTWQVECGGAGFFRTWLHRGQRGASAPWTVLPGPSATQAEAVACARSKSIPRDIRCGVAATAPRVCGSVTLNGEWHGARARVEVMASDISCVRAMSVLRRATSRPFAVGATLAAPAGWKCVATLRPEVGYNPRYQVGCARLNRPFEIGARVAAP